MKIRIKLNRNKMVLSLIINGVIQQMKITKIIGLSLLVGLTNVAYANADADAILARDLILDNKTDNYVTSYINNLTCSSLLGNDGITGPHEKKTVKGNVIAGACLFHENACTADVFLDKDCGKEGGIKVGTVVLNTKRGISAITMVPGVPYSITGLGGFKVSLSGV
jgi:hypothetical protein